MHGSESGGPNVENATAADEDANGDGEADASGRVVRHALAEWVERVEQHVGDRVWEVGLGVRQGGHDGDPEGEEGGGEDGPGARGDGAAGEGAETAARDLAIVGDVEEVVPGDGGVAGHEGGEEVVGVEADEVEGWNKGGGLDGGEEAAEEEWVVEVVDAAGFGYAE